VEEASVEQRRHRRASTDAATGATRSVSFIGGDFGL
jgi:hypothetical protein